MFLCHFSLYAFQVDCSPINNQVSRSYIGTFFRAVWMCHNLARTGWQACWDLRSMRHLEKDGGNLPSWKADHWWTERSQLSTWIWEILSGSRAVSLLQWGTVGLGLWAKGPEISRAWLCLSGILVWSRTLVRSSGEEGAGRDLPLEGSASQEWVLGTGNSWNEKQKCEQEHSPVTGRNTASVSHLSLKAISSQGAFVDHSK